MLFDEDRYFLKPYYKMLPLFKLFSEQNYTDEKQINAAPDSFIFFYCLPGSLHFFAPVNIIKNKYTVIIDF